MKQVITGVAPSSLKEVTVMTVWPSNAMFAVGRMLGQLYANTTGISIFNLGNFVKLASIPVALALYFVKILPVIGTRYRITNRRILVEKGLQPVESKAVDLDRFDSVQIEVRPGQAWYDAGDLVFYLGKIETFRLEGVSRPDAVRQNCMKSQLAYTGVKKAIERELANA